MAAYSAAYLVEKWAAWMVCSKVEQKVAHWAD